MKIIVWHPPAFLAPLIRLLVPKGSPAVHRDR